MKKPSSNSSMKPSIELLSQIRHVEPPDALYAKVLQRIQKQQTISIRWVRAAAAIIVCIISVELYMFANLSQSHNQTNLTELVPVTDNMLYHE